MNDEKICPICQATPIAEDLDMCIDCAERLFEIDNPNDLSKGNFD